MTPKVIHQTKTEAREHRLFFQAERAIEAQRFALHAKETGRIPFVADDPDCPDVMRLAALGEEFGEVCRALHDGNAHDLGVELSHLAGVALAWGVALEAARTDAHAV